MAIRDVIKTLGEQTVASVRGRFFDMRHRAEAMEAVGAIEGHSRRRLTKAMRAQADDYARSVFGSIRFAPWLYVYTLISGQFREGWIPDNYFGRIVIPAVNGDLRFVPDYKTFSNVVLQSDALPDIAYFIEGVCYDRTMSVIDVREIRDFLPSGQEDVFVKQDDSCRGIGVQRLSCDALNDDFCRSIENCVVQAPIEQHPFFDEIISGSVATIRITTVRETDGSISRRAAYLRLGRSDTAWIQAENSLQTAIVSDDGDLDATGYTQDWRSYTTHPDTGVAFENRCIPKFSEAVATCVGLHARIPQFAIIGWDIAIDRDEKVKIIEWNADHPGIKFSESTTGPCFRGLGWEKLRDGSPAATS